MTKQKKGDIMIELSNEGAYTEREKGSLSGLKGKKLTGAEEKFRKGIDKLV